MRQINFKFISQAFQGLRLSILLTAVSFVAPSSYAQQCHQVFSEKPRLQTQNALSQPSESYSEGYQFADLWIKERMSPRYMWDPRVAEIPYPQDAFDIGSRGAKFFVQRSTFTELQRFAQDADFANGFADRLGQKLHLKALSSFNQFGSFTKLALDGPLFQKMARMLIAFKYLGSLPKERKNLSEAEFIELAKLEGLKPEQFTELYRVDSRPPDQVIQAGGFYPRADRPKAILTTHSSLAANAQGTGFVSTSTSAGNQSNLQIYPIASAAQVVSRDRNKIQMAFKDIDLSKGPKPRTGLQLMSSLPDPQLELLKTYEYKISQQLGVKPDPRFSLPTEKEVVTPYVKNENIVSVREVMILGYVQRTQTGEFRDIETLQIVHSNWMPY